MYELTLADQDVAQKAADASRSSSGQHLYLKNLSQHPLAISELGRPRGYDHIHLSQADGTPFVAWMGRASSGYHHKIGRWMRLIEIEGPSFRDVG